jgi:multidrug efflux pump subunit AcrA (membrane-fusion protein)
MNMKTLGILTFISFMLLGYSCKGPDSKVNKNEFVPLKISTSKVITQDITDSVQIFGLVKARNEVYLSSQFSGRLKGFSLLQGDKVSEGQQIGVVIPPMREALSQVMSDLTDEQRKLVANEVNEIPLYSPISGTITEIMRKTGDVIQIGEPIVHISNLSVLDIYGDLPIVYLQQLRNLKSLKVSFIDYSHNPIDLAIGAIAAKVDEQKQSIQIRMTLNNKNEEFRPGMKVKMVFPDKIHRYSLIIPREALLEEEGIYSVFVVENSVAEQRTVEVGIKHADFVEILSGVENGEIVATKKVYSLTNGMKVSAE